MEEVALINLVIHGIFAFFGLVLNTFTLVVIALGTKFGRGMKLQLGNLAIADLLCSLLTPGSAVVGGIVILPYPDSTILCKMQQYITSVAFCTSLLCGAAISLERLVAVYFPLKMKEYRPRHAIVVLLSAWICTFALNVDSLIDNEVVTNPQRNNTMKCVSGRYLLMQDVGGSLLYLSTTRFLIPVVTILAAYGLIAIKLLTRKRIGVKHKFSKHRKLTSVSVGNIVS